MLVLVTACSCHMTYMSQVSDGKVTLTVTLIPKKPGAGAAAVSALPTLIAFSHVTQTTGPRGGHIKPVGCLDAVYRAPQHLSGQV